MEKGWIHGATQRHGNEYQYTYNPIAVTSCTLTGRECQRGGGMHVP